jgi:hypothetical protein
MERIPKKLHLYWGRNEPLSFMRYMTAASFAHHNPGWQVIVHYPEQPNKTVPWHSHEHKSCRAAWPDWFDKLSDIPGVELRFIAGQSDRPEVLRSDLLRWKLLAEEGGFWSDFDILFRAPLDRLGVPPEADVVTCCVRKEKALRVMRRHADGRRHGKQRATQRVTVCNLIGFLASAPEAGWRFYSRVAEVAQNNVHNAQYQSAGRLAMDLVYDGSDGPWECNVHNLPLNRVYPYMARDATKLYMPGTKLPDCAGVHWYAGDDISRIVQLLVRPEMVAYCNMPLLDAMTNEWEAICERPSC